MRGSLAGPTPNGGDAQQPFKLESASQFRPGPPLDLDSKAFATDFNETKAYGAKKRTVRTPDQTATAYLWNANAINHLNQTFRDLATTRGMDFVDTVHLSPWVTAS